MARKLAGLTTAEVGLLGEMIRIALVLGVMAASTSAGTQVEVVLGVGGHEHHLGPGLVDRLVVARVARVGHQDLVAGVEQRLHEQVERFLPAIGDQDVLALHGDVVLAAQVGGHRLAQGEQTGRRDRQIGAPIAGSRCAPRRSHVPAC